MTTYPPCFDQNAFVGYSSNINRRASTARWPITDLTALLQCGIEERGDLGGLVSELDRKINEPFDPEGRRRKVNCSISSGLNVVVLAATVIRKNDPLVLALLQIVLDELLYQPVREMLQDVLGDEQVRSGKVLSDVTHLELDLASLVLLAVSLDHIRSDVHAEIACVVPVHRSREVTVAAASVHDRLDGMGLQEGFDVHAILTRDLQGRSRAADAFACFVPAPYSFRIDAIEGLGQEQPLADGVDREVAGYHRSEQDAGNASGCL